MEGREDRAGPIVVRELLAHRDFVRALARRLVHDAETADDLTQEAMVRLLGAGRPRSPRSWLRTVLQNLARRLGRGEGRRADVEQSHAASGRSTAAAPEEIAQRLELERRLTARVLALDPRARDVVLLHFYEGKTVAETAEQLAIPLETARTRLRRALDDLRATWNTELGGSREGFAALALVAQWKSGALLAATSASTTAATAASIRTLGMGVMAMTTKAKLIMAAAILLLVTGTTLLWTSRSASDRSRATSDRTPSTSTSKLAEVAATTSRAADSNEPPRRSTEPVAAPKLDAECGTLVLHVHFARDHSDAAGVMTIVRIASRDSHVSARRMRTNDAGFATFAQLPAGRVYVATDRACRDGVASFDVRVGESIERELEITRGLDLTGLVVDRRGEPVPDALVEVAPLATLDFDPEVVAVTDESGRFDVRDTKTNCLVGARAAGFTASSLTFISGKEGNEADVRLELGDGGGEVDGVVVGPDDAPVAGAMVRIGVGETWGICPHGDRAPPLAALVRSDDRGRFHAIGLDAGSQPLVALAFGFAPFETRCDVKAGTTTSIRVSLPAGATVRGLVRDAAGRPAPRVEVSFGRWEDAAHLRTSSTSEGRFELSGLPADEIELHAEHDELGKASTKVRTVAGSVASCEITLSRGVELHGRIVDEMHAPVPDAMVECMEERGWGAVVQSDRDGRFVVANCPESKLLAVHVGGDGLEPKQFRDVDPKAGDVEWVVRRRPPNSVRVVGLVVASDGKPVANAAVSVLEATPWSHPFWPTGADGRFESDLVAPGVLRVEVRSSTAPVFTSAPRDVAAHETWDVGTIRLAEGGRLVADVEGDRSGVVFRVWDAGATTWSHLLVDENSGRLRSDLLEAGEHRLFVSGPGIAAQTVPFTVRAGSETSVHVELRPGVRQLVSITIAKELEVSSGAWLRVARDGDPVLANYFTVHKDRATEEPLWLLPGEYTVAVSMGDHEAKTKTVVRSTESPAITVEVR